jgi:hypothetical protein
MLFLIHIFSARSSSVISISHSDSRIVREIAIYINTRNTTIFQAVRSFLEKGGELLKSIFWRFVKFAVVSVLLLSSGLALYIHSEGGSFDPIREIEKLRDQNRRDDALDMARFYRENQIGDNRELKDLEEGLNYTAEEKLKSLVRNGAIKGEVYDTYSGLGAISADLYD